MGGGLLCRTLIQDWDDHNAKVLISMAGPQRGVFGSGYLDGIPIPASAQRLGLREIYKFMYLNDTQDASWANMWHDPFQQKTFEQENHFLPKFQGLVGNPARYKKNLLRLEKAVFLVGSFRDSLDGYKGNRFDGGIDPWDAGVWDYYPETTLTSEATMRKIEKLEDSYIWKHDTIGLKQLHQDRKLFRGAYSKVAHGDWWSKKKVIENYVFPHLY